MPPQSAFLRVLHAIVFIAVCAFCTGSAAQNISKSVVTTAQVRAELLAYAPDGVAPGKTVWAALQLTHQPEWHTYWKNSGDSGLPTSLQWDLPRGVQAQDIAWPTPRKIRIGTLANYGYDGTVLLPVALHIAPDFVSAPSGLLELRLKAHWLVCRTECIPEDGEFSLPLALHGSTALHRTAFEASFAAQPQALNAAAQAASSLQIEGTALVVRVAGLSTWQGKTLEFFPETPDVIATAANWTQNWDQGVWNARVPLSPERSASPQRMAVVVALDNAAYRAELEVRGTWPRPGSTPAPAVTGVSASGAGASTTLSWGMALLGAMLGGILLNLMPCVFPVLAIKVMGFARHANRQREHRISALAYSAGVILSFLALGALMLALRSAGEQLGWGFQLQSPLVVAALATLFTVMGLNLGGLFEFGQFLPQNLMLLEARNPTANALLSGVLAVAVASPCTAPFMGASLGLALGLPALQALAVFAAIGLGMALPYVILSLIPAVARALPRPGAWMDTLRRAMAFPMFATAVWLIWVLGQQTGVDGALTLLALLVALAMLIWSCTLKGRSRSIFAIISIAACALLTVSIGPNIIKTGGEGAATPAGSLWQPWSQSRVEQLVAAGTPVFVDFTAAWCVTCQYNKKATLADASVLADFAAHRVVLLRADWTRRDAAITAALQGLGRNGVPVYALYQQGRTPVLLPEVLSVQAVRSALAALP